LLDRHLARSSEEGPRAAWSFVHGMLRESLELRARESGRAVSHHRACAEMLRGLRGVGVSERLGRHLLEAGDRESALAPLLEGARQRFDAGEFALSSAVLAERDAAMRRLGIAESDARWAEGWVLRSMIDIERGEVDEAARWGARAEESARKHGWRAVLAPALLARSRASRRAGDLAGANDQAREAIACYSALEDPRGVPRALHTLGVVCLMRGELDAARESQERALEMYRRIGDEAGEADCMHESAILHQQLGDMTTAVSLSQRAGALYEKLGMRGGLANALVSQGEFAREQRDFGIAEDFYRRALAIQEALGSANAVISRLNLGLALEGRGHHAEASAVFLEALPVLEKSGWRTMIACVHAELLVCSAHARDWVSWDAHQAAVAHSCAETKIVDLDLANASSKAGALALESGETSRARAAYGLALSQFRALGRPDDEAVIEQLLRTLDR